MQIRQRNLDRERSEDVVVEVDHRGIRNFLPAAGVGWLALGVWIFRGALFRNAAAAVPPGRVALVFWELAAIVLTACVLRLASVNQTP